VRVERVRAVRLERHLVGQHVAQHRYVEAAELAVAPVAVALVPVLFPDALLDQRGNRPPADRPSAGDRLGHRRRVAVGPPQDHPEPVRAGLVDGRDTGEREVPAHAGH
jgi:hypothetical protein